MRLLSALAVAAGSPVTRCNSRIQTVALLSSSPTLPTYRAHVVNLVALPYRGSLLVNHGSPQPDRAHVVVVSYLLTPLFQISCKHAFRQLSTFFVLITIFSSRAPPSCGSLCAMCGSRAISTPRGRLGCSDWLASEVY
jgi:hypothetical protein